MTKLKPLGNHMNISKPSEMTLGPIGLIPTTRPSPSKSHGPITMYGLPGPSKTPNSFPFPLNSILTDFGSLYKTQTTLRAKPVPYLLLMNLRWKPSRNTHFCYGKCNGICLLFSLLYLPDVGCFLFRFYNSSAALLTLYFPYLLYFPIWLLFLKFAYSTF